MLSWFNSPLSWQKTNPRKKKEKKRKVVNFCQIHELNLLSSTRDGTGVGKTRGAQNWKQEKGIRTAPSGTSQMRAGLSCLTKPHRQSTLPYTGGQQEKASSPVLQIVQILCTKALRQVWCRLFLSKNEHEGRQKFLFGLVTVARDTRMFALPVYEFVVQTHATLQKWT